MVSILSIDGGGIRGIIPATFLMELERRTGKSICNLFDIIAGTSTGGILAVALTVPDGQGKPKYTAEQIRAAYFEYGDAIFHRRLLHSVSTLGGFLRPTYSPHALELVLGQHLGSSRLHSTLTEILVTAYDIGDSNPWFFKTSFAKENRNPVDDPLLSQVVRATTAAPTYFPPVSLDDHCLIDGVVFAGNPALCAYAQARNMFPLENEFLVVSLGTGVQEHDRLCSEIRNWGTAEWAGSIIGIMLNASSESVNYQMRTLVGSKNYHRFQVKLESNAAAMDDTSTENMHRLLFIAEQAVRQESAAIDQISQTLGNRSIRQIPLILS